MSTGNSSTSTIYERRETEIPGGVPVTHEGRKHSVAECLHFRYRTAPRVRPGLADNTDPLQA